MNMLDGLPRPGDLIATKYQVEEVLGHGGMGVVVAARHTVLQQRVAVKFLLPAATKFPGATARFLREAQAVVALQSEHVARVYDVGTLESGAPYMVMEHLAGSDLARLLTHRGTFQLDEAIDYVLQACEAIAEAHSIGIIHRDIKPANLFLTRRPEGSPLVKVLDFGISKVPLPEGPPQENALTATNVVAGSPHYMSPEQVRSLKLVDARTDIWAIGVTLYELLTGHRPFNGPTPGAICASVAADAPPAPSKLRTDLPLLLETIILRCLEKDLTRRIQTLAEFAYALRPIAPQRSMASIERICRLLPEKLLDTATPTIPLPRRGVANPGPRTVPTPEPMETPEQVAIEASVTDSNNSAMPGALELPINRSSQAVGSASEARKIFFRLGVPLGLVLVAASSLLYWFSFHARQSHSGMAEQGFPDAAPSTTSAEVTTAAPQVSNDPPSASAAQAGSAVTASTTLTTSPKRTITKPVGTASAVSVPPAPAPPPPSAARGIVRERK